MSVSGLLRPLTSPLPWQPQTLSGGPPYRRICHSSVCVCVCVYVWVGVCVCACVFLMRRLHCVCESAFLFAPFTTEVASIIQQHIAEHNATHCIALSLPQESSVFICLLLDCFYAPIMFPAAPSPSPASSAHFICLRTLVMFPQLELRICQTAHFFLHSLVSVFFVSLLSYSWFSFIYCIH